MSRLEVARSPKRTGVAPPPVTAGLPPSTVPNTLTSSLPPSGLGMYSSQPPASTSMYGQSPSMYGQVGNMYSSGNPDPSNPLNMYGFTTSNQHTSQPKTFHATATTGGNYLERSNSQHDPSIINPSGSPAMPPPGVISTNPNAPMPGNH